MPIPASARVRYEKTPLAQVICQLRYPTILKISEEIPAEFQEKIRDQYPLYEKQQAPPVEMMDTLSQLPPKFFSSLESAETAQAHEFSARNRNQILNLNNDFLALTDRDYRQWEDFRKHILDCFNTFSAIYKPSFLTRVGLRYQNLIVRSQLGLEKDVPWAELLNANVAGIMADSNISPDVELFVEQVVIRLKEYKAKVKMNLAIGKNTVTNEPIYVIDNDIFTDEQTEVDNVATILDYFNQQNRYLFRWAISEKLHTTMVSRSIAKSPNPKTQAKSRKNP